VQFSSRHLDYVHVMLVLGMPIHVMWIFELLCPEEAFAIGIVLDIRIELLLRVGLLAKGK
jgi:hypothetical protein